MFSINKHMLARIMLALVAELLDYQKLENLTMAAVYEFNGSGQTI